MRAALRPGGSRGVALFHRGARYGTDPEAIENARERVFGIAQIESPEAVEAVEEIAAIDGIDVLFVGPSDLSFSMGMFRDFDDPEFRSAIERVNERGAGRRQGGRDLPHRRPTRCPAALADGFRMIALGSDGSYMMQAARARRWRQRVRRGRAERGAHRLGAEVRRAATAGCARRERLAVLLARPLGLVARLDEVRQRVAPGVQAARAHDDRADAGLRARARQLVGERGQLAHLEHVVDRHLGVAEALA